MGDRGNGSHRSNLERATQQEVPSPPQAPGASQDDPRESQDGMHCGSLVGVQIESLMLAGSFRWESSMSQRRTVMGSSK